MEELTITFNDIKYIVSDILFEKAPIYCKTCRTTRDIIKKKEIVAAKPGHGENRAKISWKVSDDLHEHRLTIAVKRIGFVTL
jgi:hypothetical protein